jgi:antitoxin YefM
MDAIICSSARARLPDTMDRACDDHEPIIIARNGQQAIVMMALDDHGAGGNLLPAAQPQELAALA